MKHDAGGERIVLASLRWFVFSWRAGGRKGRLHTALWHGAVSTELSRCVVIKHNRFFLQICASVKGTIAVSAERNLIPCNISSRCNLCRWMLLYDRKKGRKCIHGMRSFGKNASVNWLCKKKNAAKIIFDSAFSNWSLSHFCLFPWCIHLCQDVNRYKKI